MLNFLFRMKCLHPLSVGLRIRNSNSVFTDPLAPYSRRTLRTSCMLWNENPDENRQIQTFYRFLICFCSGFCVVVVVVSCLHLFFLRGGGGGGGGAFRRPMPEPEIPPFREFAPPLKNSPFFAKMVMDVCFNREWRAELWPIDAIWWHMFGSAAAQVMVLYTKPLPEPMSTYNQWGTVIFVGEYFHKKYHRHQSLKLAWNILIQNFFRVFQGPMS